MEKDEGQTRTLKEVDTAGGGGGVKGPENTFKDERMERKNDMLSDGKRGGGDRGS